MIKSVLEVCTYRVLIRQISKVLVSCNKSHFITFSCYHNHLQGHQVVNNDATFNDAAKTMIKLNSTEDCTKQFPKIGRYRKHKIQRCIVCMSKKQTIPQMWQYWITSTMSWHWNANCNIENPSVHFLLAATDSSVCRKRIPGPDQPPIPCPSRRGCSARASRVLGIGGDN